MPKIFALIFISSVIIYIAFFAYRLHVEQKNNKGPVGSTKGHLFNLIALILGLSAFNTFS